jgi:hypothetical protein
MSTLPGETPATDPDSRPDWDVVVAGGGAAGLSAAVFLARYGLETLVLARGKSAIHQCAHLENYLGFPGGISPERFLTLGRAQADHEGATVEDDTVESVEPHDAGFVVATQEDREIVATYVLAASAYDGDYLSAFADELGAADADDSDAGDSDDTDDSDADHDFLDTDAGRTPVEGLYAAGWLTDDTVHQAVVNAGDGARAALSLIRDELTDRYWAEIGDIYVDWVVDADRYGGEEWHENVDGWFDREIAPGAPQDVDDETLAEVRTDLKTAFLDRGITADERDRRARDGQHRLLDAIDDEVIREYAVEIDAD